MPIPLTLPLRREIVRALPERPFGVRFWDGGDVAATLPGSPTFEVKAPSALAHFLRCPDALGLFRAYVEGSLSVDELDDAFLVVDNWDPPELPLGAGCA